MYVLSKLCIQHCKLVVSSGLIMESEEFCIISDLLLKPFSRRSIAEKSEIVKKDRPCPEIPNLTSEHKDKNGKYVRHFKVSQYANIPWLAGSKKLSKLFC